MAEQQLYRQSDISDSVQGHDTISRRGFLYLAGLAGLATALAPRKLLAAEPSLEELAKQWDMPLERVQQIYREMHQPVADTLQGTSVREVTPYNYDELVTGSGKPGLVLFYADRQEWTGSNPSRGLASVYRAIEQQFGNQVNFFILDNLKWIGEKNSDYERLFPRKHCGVTNYPSTVMYSPYDLLKGETPKRNGGRVKRIDILNGGFSKTKYHQKWAEVLDEWIRVNLIKPNNQFVTRFENGGPPPKKKLV